MIVGIKYLKDGAFYGGPNYNYTTALPLQGNDKVMVAVGKNNEMKRAIVTRVNVPEEEVPAHILPLLKEITEYDVTEEAAANG